MVKRDTEEGDSLAGIMAKVRTRAARWTREPTLSNGFRAKWFNLEVVNYPAWDYLPDPERGAEAVKKSRIPGKFHPRTPLQAYDLNQELALIWALNGERRRRQLGGERIPPELGKSIDYAIALNRTVWRDATIAESVPGTEAGVIGDFIRVERARNRNLSELKLEVRWQRAGEPHRLAGLPSLEEAWVVILGGHLPHAIQSTFFVVDFGLASVQSWAACTACSGLSGPCECRFCMHRLDPETERDPELELRLREDPALAPFMEMSTGSGWGPRGDLSALKRANPTLSAYGARLESLFGREQIEAARRRFDGWARPRASGKTLGRPRTWFDATTLSWIDRRRVELGSLRKVYTEYVQRWENTAMSYSTFERRYRSALAAVHRKAPVSAAPD
jgi:hypothetical protein